MNIYSVWDIPKNIASDYIHINKTTKLQILKAIYSHQKLIAQAKKNV